MRALIDEVQQYVEKQLKTELDSCIVYHNLSHTKEVVEQVQVISKASGLSQHEQDIVTLAAWFHDFGFVSSCAEHEKCSSRLAQVFLTDRELHKEDVQQVQQCILATAMGVEPKNEMERVLKDADLSHLASPSAFEKSIRLRREWEKTLGKVYSDEDWYAMNCSFFDGHEYYTDYAKKEFAEGKQRNREILEELYQMAKRGNQTGEPKKKKKKGNKSKPAAQPEVGGEYPTAKLDRGIESMFRITLRNHIDLSAIADNKANIMLSVNAVIVSIILSVLVRKLDVYPHLLFPTMLILGVCVTTIIFATLATRPNITSGAASEADIKKKKTNLLFFGNFTHMNFEDYLSNMKGLIGDKEYLYNSMIKDLYYLGQAVNRKYKFLRLCYNVFMFGIILSVLSFGVAELVTPQNDKVAIEDIIED